MFKRLKKKKKPAVQSQTQRQDTQTDNNYSDALIGIASATILDDEPIRRTTSSSSSDSGSSFDSGSFD